MTGPERIRAPHRERPPVSLIEESILPYEAALYVGGREGASDLRLLRSLGIGTVINCAVNLDLNLVTEQDGAMGVDSVPYGHGAVRYYKLGLVDGPGNAETMMLAGYYLLRGALSQVLPDRSSYPRRERGNVLVNCRGGRSRSVALVALLLHHTMPEKYPTLDAALDHVRRARGLGEDEWFEAPKPMLIEAARKASAWIDRIGHEDPSTEAQAQWDAFPDEEAEPAPGTAAR